MNMVKKTLMKQNVYKKTTGATPGESFFFRSISLRTSLTKRRANPKSIGPIKGCSTTKATVSSWSKDATPPPRVDSAKDERY